MTTKSSNEIDEEVARLRVQMKAYKRDKLKLQDVERQLDRTLYDLGVHQEELRSQNEELNRAYERLEELLGKYSVLFEDSPVAYFAIDTRQRVVNANRAAATLLQSAKEDLIGKTLLTHLPRKSIAVVSDHFRRVMLSGSATDEIVLSPKSHSLTSYIFQSQRIADPDTRRPVSLTVLFDISQRKKAEQQIAYLAEQNRRVLDSVGEGVLGIGLEGFIVFANPAAESILGWGSDSLLGREPFELLKPKGEEGDEVASADSLFGKTFSDGETRKISGVSFQGRDGRWIAVEYVIAPTFDEGAISGLVVTFRDVSQQKKIEKALMQAKNAAEAGSRAKSEFLSIASHELRTPLNAIMGMTDFLLASKLTDEQRDFAATIQQSGRGLLSLISDILELSSIDAGKQELTHSSVNLVELVDGVFKIVLPSAREKKIELVSSFSAEVPETMFGDERKIRQVLLHLLSNAIKFSANAQVNLTVKGKRKGRGKELHALLFSITDKGVGIAKKNIHHVFQPFTQVDSSNTRKYGGTGLGLTLCKRFVEGMGGRIDLTSKLGVGSTFSFTLPLASPGTFLLPKEPLVTGFVPEQTELFPKDARLLVVEDDVVNRALTMGMLRRMQLHAEVAENGKVALDLLKEKRFSLVLMDIQMPEMDGLTATRQFRKFEKKEKRSHRTPIIATTAYSLNEHQEACMKAGMDAFITKPLIHDKLKLLLIRWLKKPSAKPTTSSDQTSLVNQVVLEGLRQDMGDDFEMIIELFLEILPQRVQAIQKAADSLDGEAIHLQTHPLKSSSRQVGLDKLSAIVEIMDGFARSGKGKKAVKLMPQFEEACEQAQKALLLEISKP
ncbi:MAG: PAS domain S-box protein [Magnetococcales bacterium]|nr:PAS domain S-box protein [Magnetococcales bacterium]